MEARTRLYSLEEMKRRAEELYARIKPEEDQDNIGKFLMVDVESGDYEIGEDDMKTSDLLHARHENAQVFTFRIGYETAYTFCGTMKRRAS